MHGPPFRPQCVHEKGINQGDATDVSGICGEAPPHALLRSLTSTTASAPKGRRPHTLAGERHTPRRALARWGQSRDRRDRVRDGAGDGRPGGRCRGASLAGRADRGRGDDLRRDLDRARLCPHARREHRARPPPRLGRAPRNRGTGASDPGSRRGRVTLASSDSGLRQRSLSSPRTSHSGGSWSCSRCSSRTDARARRSPGRGASS
jgi:hypothetical protein